MKTTLSGTLRVVALIGLGLATIITLGVLESPAAKPDPEDVDNLVLVIAKKNGEYRELITNDCVTENKFIKLLNNPKYLRSHKLHFKHTDPSNPECDLPDGCAECKPSSATQLNIKTDKVTVANAAQSVAAGDPHVTIQVAAKSPADIKAVLDMLK
jgi:hypothetical protein